jgi:hypothetical protein
VIWIAGILGGWVLLGVLTIWVIHRQRALPAAPVPYWPAAATPCTWCKPVPEGMCTCAGKCGHVNCVGDYTSMAGLTEHDVRWLREQSIRGHE